MEITINTELINFFATMMCEPKKLGLDLLPLQEVFIKSNKITPNHILYEQYLKYFGNRLLPKVVFYIVMSKVFGATSIDFTGEDKSAGYYLAFNENIKI